MHADDTNEMVQHVLSEFGLSGATVELLDSIDHCNVRVTADRSCYFLKILASEQTTPHLRSRLQYADFLRAGGLSIPRSIETITGEPFAGVTVEGETRLCILSEWVDGQTLRGHTDARWIERCGDLLARMHTRSNSFEPPDDFQSRVWDEVCVPADSGWLQSWFAEFPHDAAVKTVIDNAVDRARSLETRLPKDGRTYGLIHADFHGDNLIFDGQTIWIIDLDDVGWGYYLFDVAWPVVLFAKGESDFDLFLDPFLRGYERIRPLSVSERNLLPDFLLAAGIGALEMIHSSPIANDSPKAREWFDFIVHWLRKHLDTSMN